MLKVRVIEFYFKSQLYSYYWFACITDCWGPRGNYIGYRWSWSFGRGFTVFFKYIIHIFYFRWSLACCFGYHVHPIVKYSTGLFSLNSANCSQAPCRKSYPYFKSFGSMTSNRISPSRNIIWVSNYEFKSVYCNLPMCLLGAKLCHIWPRYFETYNSKTMLSLSLDLNITQGWSGAIATTAGHCQPQTNRYLDPTLSDYMVLLLISCCLYNLEIEKLNVFVCRSFIHDDDPADMPPRGSSGDH